MSTEEEKLFNGLYDMTFSDVLTVMIMHEDDVYDRPNQNPIAARFKWKNVSYIWYVPGTKLTYGHLKAHLPTGKNMHWVPSDEDILAKDWLITTDRDKISDERRS
jgi:hypothetical protein